MAQENTVPSASRALLTGSGRWRDRLARRLVLARLRAIESGRIEIAEGATRRVFGRVPGDPPLTARLTVHDPACWTALAVGGSIGAGEAWSSGWWTSEDPTAVVRVMARNREALRRLDGGAARLVTPLRRLAHRRRRNTPAGSRRNIAAHYDTGNSFFAAFLDPGLTYSCGVFEREDASLDEAQQAKLELVCRKLDLRPRDRLVEIGTGWGSLAIHAARTRGCRIVTTTISERQLAHARRAVAEAGLADRVTVLGEDYRALALRLPGGFDKLVSIEMIEAVGHRGLPDYFTAVSGLLRPGGLALLQAILIPDQRYERYRRSVDFTQRHIFPGGLLPSLARLQACAATASDLRLLDLEDLTAHYPPTLAAWRSRFEANADRIAGLGMSRWERRKWRFYFAYCEAGFLERAISVAQLLYAKPGFRGRAPHRRWTGAAP